MRALLVLGAIGMAKAVAFGAFGAHGLAKYASAEQLAIWKIAVDYHTYAALGLLLMGVMPRYLSSSASHVTGFGVAGTLLALGAVLFSGSLYGMVLVGQRWLGFITPLGGIMMMAAWFYFAWIAWKIR